MGGRGAAESTVGNTTTAANLQSIGRDQIRYGGGAFHFQVAGNTGGVRECPEAGDVLCNGSAGGAVGVIQFDGNGFSTRGGDIKGSGIKREGCYGGILEYAGF